MKMHFNMEILRSVPPYRMYVSWVHYTSVQVIAVWVQLFEKDASWCFARIELPIRTPYTECAEQRDSMVAIAEARFKCICKVTN